MSALEVRLGYLRVCVVFVLFSLLASVVSAVGAAAALQTHSIDLICMLFKALRSITGLIAVFVIVAAGLRWVMSENDPGQRKLAKEIVISVMVGLVVIVIAVPLATTIMRGGFSGCP